MPTYVNLCSDCEWEWENIASIKSEPVKECPCCESNNVNRVPQAFHLSVVNGNTLGALAEKNAKKMGGQKDEKLQKMANDRKIEFKGKMPEGASVKDYQIGTPWWRKPGEKVDTNLAKMTEKEKLKFVMENKKPIGLDKRSSEPTSFDANTFKDRIEKEKNKLDKIK